MVECSNIGSPRDADYLFKILILGESGVGKSSILLQYTDQTFSGLCVATIGQDFKTRRIEVDGKKIELQVWDTAGQERFRTITSSYFRNAHGIILTYDITQRASFDRVLSWLQEIGRFAPHVVKKVLVGNKVDLKDMRVVDADEAKDFSSQNMLTYFETSAKTGAGVPDVFKALSKEIMKDWDKIQKARRESTRGTAGTTQFKSEDDENFLDQEPGCCCLG